MRSSVADQLRARITSGALAPGAPLRQEQLAAELGVSRIPVRDALTLLHAEGLVDLRPTGSCVATLTEPQAAELFDLRVLLEVDALRRAVPNHTPRTLRRVAAVQAELELADDTAEWATLDRAFHEALYGPSERPRTLDTIRVFRNVAERFALAALSHDVRRDAWRDEHRGLLDAVGAGDVARAADALTAHLRATEAVVRDAIRQLV